MSPKWVVTTATERVALDESRGGEVTFTVTNQSNRNSRAVFDIRAGDGVDESWFTIDDPQRPIRPAASVPYLVKIQVGAQVPPGSYEIAGRVCPPDTAPEESFLLSRRVLIEVPPPPAPPQKKFPWWIVVAAALLALVIGVVTWLVWPSGAAEPAPMPSPSAVASAAPVVYAEVPKLTGLSHADATAALAKAGFTVGIVRYRAAPQGSGQVAQQSVPGTALAATGTEIDLEVTAAAGRPVISAPDNNSSVRPNTMPELVWTQPNAWVTRWLVLVFAEQCVRINNTDQCRTDRVGPAQMVTAREHQPPLPKLNYVANAQGFRHNGWVVIQIQPLDDLGNVSEVGSVRVYLEH